MPPSRTSLATTMTQDSRLASNKCGHSSTNSMKSTDVKTPAIFSSGSHSTGKTGGCVSGGVS